MPRHLLTTALIALALPAAAADRPRVVEGGAIVVDGDTLHVGRQTIRLSGIDAPEIGKMGGAFAAGRLDALVGARRIRCEVLTADRYQRLVAHCATDAVPDLGRAMLEAGAARVYDRYVKPADRDAYRAAEGAARKAGRGIWR